ncbi:hypothetical protein F5884DRAFT_362609 [Xylogone sp. PMI_703]|nr:hypothetical protein F5884DRAFT_362609 [Xylogone sp. PMI_703]
MSDYERIAKQAEADLNTYQSKTGAARPEGLTDSGVNTYAEKKFEGAQVFEGDELSTNRSYNKRIPPSEGGELDDRGRQTRGEHFEGEGGPRDKFNPEGRNDNDIARERVPRDSGIDFTNSEDLPTQGQRASQANVGRDPPGPGGSAFKGDDYYRPDPVPDSTSAEGYIAPESTTEPSRESQQY